MVQFGSSDRPKLKGGILHSLIALTVVMGDKFL